MMTRTTSTLAAMLGCLVLLNSGCGTDSSSHPAEAAVKTIISGVEDGRPIVVWEAMPPSYQSDVNELVQAFGTNMDPEAWGQITGFLNNIHEILSSKQEFILNYPQIAASENSEELRAAIKQGTTALRTLIDATQNLDKLKSFDGATFLNSTGKDIVAQIIEMQEMANQSSGIKMSSELNVKTLKSTDTSAKIRFTSSDGKQDQVIDFVLQDGKWLPKQMVDGWDEDMQKAKASMAQLPEQAAAIKGQMMMVTTMASGVLAPLQAAENQEQFNQAVDGVMSGVGGMLGGMMGGMGGPASGGQAPGSQGFGGGQ